MNKILKKLSIIFISTLGVIFVASTPVSAAQYIDTTGCDQGNFLGLITWCNGVDSINDEESLKSGIWHIAANVGVDLTVISAYLVLGFVIYGGYLYLLSGGEVNKITTGKKTIINAFVGLGIVLAANIIFNTLRFVLIGNRQLQNCYSSEGCPTPSTVVTSAIQWVVGIAGLVAAIFLIIGGISYMTSAGESAKIEKAKKTILYAVIGLAIVGFAEIITGFVSSILKDANAQAGQSILPDHSISYHISNEETSVPHYILKSNKEVNNVEKTT